MKKRLAIYALLLWAIALLLNACTSGITDSSDSSQPGETVPGERVQGDHSLEPGQAGRGGTMRW